MGKSNCRLTTIGLLMDGGFVRIGNNVDIGASCVIIGGQIEIGDGAVIGAMSFVNKSIAAKAVVITEKKLKVIG